jgi:hypothetical protein
MDVTRTDRHRSTRCLVRGVGGTAEGKGTTMTSVTPAEVRTGAAGTIVRTVVR